MSMGINFKLLISLYFVSLYMVRFFTSRILARPGGSGIFASVRPDLLAVGNRKTTVPLLRVQACGVGV
jgi:hypothetical protein